MLCGPQAAPGKATNGGTRTFAVAATVKWTGSIWKQDLPGTIAVQVDATWKTLPLFKLLIVSEENDVGCKPASFDMVCHPAIDNHKTLLHLGLQWERNYFSLFMAISSVPHRLPGLS